MTTIETSSRCLRNFGRCKNRGEYYLFTPGFLDDSLAYHLRVEADSVEDIFDLAVIDPTESGSQQVGNGRFVELAFTNPEPGVFFIEGFWFET